MRILFTWSVGDKEVYAAASGCTAVRQIDTAGLLGTFPDRE